LITLLALNGLRISEALNADIDDLFTERGHRTLAIVRKGGKHVTVPIAPRTGRALDLYIGERTMGPIFLGVQGGRMDRYCTNRMVKRLVKRAGIDKRISPHSLRHSFITAALDAGVPLRDVQEAASHADPRTTMRYGRARGNLDRHATYIVATFIAGATRPASPSPTAVTSDTCRYRTRGLVGLRSCTIDGERDALGASCRLTVHTQLEAAPRP
jgi:integrase